MRNFFCLLGSLLVVTLGSASFSAQQPDAEERESVPVRRRLQIPTLQRYRGQVDKELTQKISEIDRLCRLSEDQKRILNLAGRGDIKHYMDRLEDACAELQAANDDSDRIDDLKSEQDAFTRAASARRFAEDSLLGKVLRKYLSRAQVDRYDACCEIEALGGRVKTRPRGTELEIALEGSKFGDDHFPRLATLDDLVLLRLSGTQVSDKGLVHLKALGKLETLDLTKTGLTDAGMGNLKGLSRLKALSLNDTEVSSSGLAQIKSLKSLRQLALGGTQVDDAGLAHLRDLSELRLLDLARTRVTDAGLPQLKHLKNLRYVGLNGTRVTEAGVNDLKRALPNSNVSR